MPELDRKKVRAEEHESFMSFSLITVVIPIIGIIVGIAYLTKDESLDKKLGEHLIAFGIFAAIIQSLLYYLFVGSYLRN